MWGTSRDNVWLVGLELTGPFGGSAVIAHFDGKDFKTERPRATTGLLGIFGGSSSDVWAVGHQGTALHFDGHEWSRVATGVVTDLLGGLTDPDGTVWLTGKSAILRHRERGRSTGPAAP